MKGVKALNAGEVTAAPSQNPMEQAKESQS